MSWKEIKEWFQKIIGYIGIVITIYVFGRVTVGRLVLPFYGEKTKAVVTYVGFSGSAHHLDVSYEFSVDSVEYEGELGSYADDVSVGDTLTITYLPCYPKITMNLDEEDDLN